MIEEEISAQRKSWELEDHWKLRKAFLEAYYETFDDSKLLCLAQIFVNIETLGVQYGKDVMEEMSRLSENIPYLVEYRAIKEKRDEESVERRKTRKEAKNNASASSNNSNSGGYGYGQNYRNNQRNQSNYGYNKRARGGGYNNNSGNYQNHNNQQSQHHPYSQYSRNQGGPSSSRHSY